MAKNEQIEAAIQSIIGTIGVDGLRQDSVGCAVFELLPRHAGLRLSSVHTARVEDDYDPSNRLQMLLGTIVPLVDADMGLAVQESRPVIVLNTSDTDAQDIALWERLGCSAMIHIPLDPAGGIPSAAHKVHCLFTIIVDDSELLLKYVVQNETLLDAESSLGKSLRRLKVGRLSLSDPLHSFPQIVGKLKDPVASLFANLSREMGEQGLMMARAWSVERRAERDEWNLQGVLIDGGDVLRQVDRVWRNAATYESLFTRLGERYTTYLARAVRSDFCGVSSTDAPVILPSVAKSALCEILIPLDDGVDDMVLVIGCLRQDSLNSPASPLPKLLADLREIFRDVMSRAYDKIPKWRREILAQRILRSLGERDAGRRHARLWTSLHAWLKQDISFVDELTKRVETAFAKVISLTSPLYLSAWYVREGLHVRYSKTLGGPWIQAAGSFRSVVDAMSDRSVLARLQLLVRCLGLRTGVWTLRWDPRTSTWTSKKGHKLPSLPSCRWPASLETTEAIALRVAETLEGAQVVFLPEVLVDKEGWADIAGPLDSDRLSQCDSFIEIRMSRRWPQAELCFLENMDASELGRVVAEAELPAKEKRRIITGPLAAELLRKHPTMTMNIAAALHPGGAYRSAYREEYNALLSGFEHDHGGVTLVADSIVTTRLARLLYLSRFGAGEEGDPCLVRYARILLRPDGYRERGVDPPILHSDFHVRTGLESYATHLVSFVREGSKNRQSRVIEVFAWRAGFSPAEAEASGPRGSVRRSLRLAVGAVVDRHLGEDPRNLEPRAETAKRLARELKERRHFRTDLITWNREQARDVSQLIRLFLGDELFVGKENAQPIRLPNVPPLEIPPKDAHEELMTICMALEHLLEATGDKGRTRLRWSLVMDARGDRALRRLLFKWTEWFVTHADSWQGPSWDRMFLGLVNQMLS